MDKKLPIYRVVADESEIYGMSVVQDPANEQSFVMFSKDEPKKFIACFESEEKHNIIGVALIPNQLVYRCDDYGNEFYITFEADTIEKLAHKYIGNGFNTYMTKDHYDWAEGLSIAESWIKTSENDKSVDYGIDAPIGSWLLMAHCDSIDLWQSFKDGKRTGFSIESMVQLEQIQENNSKTESKEDMAKETKQNVEVNEGFWTKMASIVANALAPKADVKLEEETPSEEEEKTPEEVAEEAAAVVEEQAETNEEAAEDLQAVVDALQAEVDSLKAENEELKKANQKMAKTPSTKVNVKQSAAKQNPMDVVAALRNGTYFK